MDRKDGVWGRLLAAARHGDDDSLEAALVDLSRRHRLLAPLSLSVGAFLMLFQGLKLLFTNWRLTLVQLLPATLIWAAMLDLKVHALKGASFDPLRGPVLIPLVLATAVLTAGAPYLNAVFAIYISDRGSGHVADSFRPAFGEAARHRRTILAWGFAIGLGLGFATLVATRWGRGWFSLLLGIVVAVMMVTYVTVPAALAGIRSDRTPREQLTTSAVGGAMSAVLCSPPYALGRLGIVLLGSRSLFALGLVLLVIAAPLQAGAVSASKTVKLSAKLLAGAGRPGQGEPGTRAATTPADARVPAVPELEGRP